MKGMEGLISTVIKSLGLDPEEIKATITEAKGLLHFVGNALQRIEAKQDEILTLLKEQKKEPEK